MTKSAFEEIMDHWITTGKYYGYPSCCISSFCESSDLSIAQHRVHQNLGFIPCSTCATKILSGEATLESLITNRLCPTAFPADDMD